MVKLLRNHFNWYEVKSLATTFVAFFAVEATMQIERVLSGDLSKEALMAVLVALARSVIKFVLNSTIAITKKKPEAI